MRTWLPLAFLACTGAREPLTNTAASGSAVRIGPTEPLGWIGLATAPERGDSFPRHAPVSAEHPLVTIVGRESLPASVAAIATHGGIQQLTTGPRAEVRYGCDGNTLEVTTFAGPRLTPGAVWLLPPARPSSWRPTPLRIEQVPSTATERWYRLGLVALQLTRTADLRGTLAIHRGGRIVHTVPFERHLMEGADSSPIDLTEGGPGIPEPIAAWAIADSGPVLLVLTQPGYEGTTLRALLVEETSARAIESMEMYLYSCAF